MPQEVILLKLGEIALKGLNRKAFEDVLLKNIRRRLGKAGEFTVASRQSTITWNPQTTRPTWTWRRSGCARCSAWWATPGRASRKRT